MRWYPGHTDVADEIVQAAAGPGHLEVDFHDPLTASLAGAIAVVSATGDERDEKISARARDAGIPVNVVDRTDLSTFAFPAIVDRGEVVVAIGTNAHAPVLARRLRERIEAMIPARVGDLADADRPLSPPRRRGEAEIAAAVLAEGRGWSDRRRGARRPLRTGGSRPRPSRSSNGGRDARTGNAAPCSWSAPAPAIPIC